MSSELPNAGTFVTVHYASGDMSFGGETTSLGEANVNFVVSPAQPGQQVLISVVVGDRTGCSAAFVIG